MIEFAMVLQLAASATTLAASWLYGNKSLWGPGLGLVSQVPWWSIMIIYSLWGLAPVNVVMLFIHARNYLKWKAEE